MEETGRTFLKWTLAVIVLAGVCIYAVQNVGDAFRSGIAFGEPSESESEPQAPTPVVNGEAFPQVDFALVGNMAGFFASDGMVLGPGPEDGFVLSFPMIDGDPNCVATARVEIPVRSATPAQLALYPSAIPDLAVITEGTPVQGAIEIPLAAPPLANTEANPALLAWDVGQIYRTWATGQPFDGTTPGPADPQAFTVVIRPNDQGVPDRNIAVTSSESPEPNPRPRLVWEGAPDCPAAAGTPTTPETAAPVETVVPTTTPV